MFIKRLTKVIFMSLLMLPLTAQADWDLGEIINILAEINGVKLKGIDEKNAQTIAEIKNMQNLLKGNSGFGAKDYVDYQSWGKGAEDWGSALNVYNTGSGTLGNLAKKLNSDPDNGFPINPNLKTFNPKDAQDRYSLLQAKTALASRAASQLAFDKIQDQITYHQKNLQPKIDTTQNLKSAVDLQNRLLFENNMIQLEMLRMAALSNQQQAIQTQSEVNHTVINKSFSSDLH